MGEGGMRDVVRQVATTPAYQLFLAAVDIAVVTELYQRGNPEQFGFLPFLAARNFGELTRFLPAVVSGGRLFVLPEGICSGQGDCLEELIKNGKIGKVTLNVGDAPGETRYYIPYSTPIGFSTGVSNDAKTLWDDARDAYYAVKG